MMYRPRAFVVDDVRAMHAAIRARVFAAIALVHEGRVQFAYAPVILDPGEGGLGAVRFHLARANAVSSLADGARVHLTFVGPNVYVSPDWYESEAMVPTWNYIAVEGEGIARRLDRECLTRLLAELSAQEEQKLSPKMPWTLDKVPGPRLEALLHAIEGFSVKFERLEGKFKLSQDKKPADFDGVLRGLDARGDAASMAVAAAMREVKGEQP